MSTETLDALLADIGGTFEVGFEPMTLDGRTLELLAVRNMTQHLDGLLARRAIRDPLKDLPLWAKVWPGSFILGRLLRHFEPEGKSLLDAGCGCGALGLVAAGYGFRRVLMGDIVPEALRFARANILRNGLQDIAEAAHVDVAVPADRDPLDEQFDIIAASEILYLDDLHRPLLKFCSRHLAPGGRAVFGTDLARGKPRFARLAQKYFKVEKRHVAMTAGDGDGGRDRRIHEILILERMA